MRSTSCWRRHRSTRRHDIPHPYFVDLNDLLALFDALPESLARQAFSHSSWVADREQSYERLAFLGDSVLNIAVSQALFPRFPHSTAGRLTKIRAQAVSRRACVDVARAIGVPERMRAAAPPGYEHQVERLVSAESVLAEAVEAGIGACLLEHGFERTADAVADAFDSQIERALGSVHDFKSELQERLARHGEVVAYRVVNEEGPPHDRLFETVAEVDGESLGAGTGRSKKESEQEAARAALGKLDDREAACT
jgi:ribonuclease III